MITSDLTYHSLKGISAECGPCLTITSVRVPQNKSHIAFVANYICEPGTDFEIVAITFDNNGYIPIIGGRIYEEDIDHLVDLKCVSKKHAESFLKEIDEILGLFRDGDAGDFDVSGNEAPPHPVH